MTEKDLCIKIAKCDNEKDIISILKAEGYWDNNDSWRYLGDQENNFSTIGNQQNKPETALVEKLINSIDAVLISECLSRKENPESPNAPQSIKEALVSYFNMHSGKLINLTKNERSQLAKRINLVATGKKSNPSYSIIDNGEGQTPNKIPETLLSISKSNKLKIPFVQGKFNMGGTGALEYCGENNLQIIITKRNPNIVKNESIDSTSDYWGFTVVRREDPKDGVRSSFYRYLAPGGSVLKFKSEYLPLLPKENKSAYGNHLEFGTFIKLIEYQMGNSLKTNIIFDLNYKLSQLMTSPALPIRLIETRDYSGHSLSGTLSGLDVRFDEDRNNHLEPAFTPPPTSNITVLGQKLKVSIIVFKNIDKKVLNRFKGNNGILFTINGQTHGTLNKRFFRRQKVRMNYLSNSLLMMVDCTGIDSRSREKLFMNSRDRLRSGDLQDLIEKELEILLKNHPGLKDLNQKRRLDNLQNKLEDDKPLVDVIQGIIKKSPILNNLFIKGNKIRNPFKHQAGKETIEKYKGLKFPSQFKLLKEYNEEKPKECNINKRFRLQYKTDVSNDYFDRNVNEGEFNLTANGNEISDFVINLWNGTATLNVKLPFSVKIGDTLHFQSKVMDVSRSEPFIDQFYTVIMPKSQNKPSNNPGRRKLPTNPDVKGKQVDQGLFNLPEITPVYKDEWENHDFNKESALKIEDGGDENGYDFFLNMDNIYLLNEKRMSNASSSMLDARFKYGFILIGLALLRNYKKENEADSTFDIYSTIEFCTRMISPVLLPLISNLGELDEQDERQKTIAA